MDFLNLENNQAITVKIGNEKIKFSDKIKKKFGPFGKFQYRKFFITNIAMYFLKKTEIKRGIKIEDLYGITYSKSSNEFVIHMNENDYDYLLSSKRRDIIIKLLNDLYEEKKKKELLFSIKPGPDLSKYAVSKKERKINPNLNKFDNNDLFPIKQFFKLLNNVSEIKNDYIKQKVLAIKTENDNIDVIYPEEENIDTNNLLTLIFQSGDQLLRCGIICKNTDIFNVIVNKIFEKKPKFKENFNFFLCNGNRINEYKSLDENNIKDGNVIILQSLE